MTNEEAIEQIKNIKIFAIRDGYTNEAMDALDIAIKALEQEPCEGLINQRATTCRHGGHCEWVACDKCNHYEPDPLIQQPCEDWYDVPSDEMTLEQAKQAVKDLRKKLAEYLEQQPCDMKQRVEKEYLYESLCEDLKKANAEIKRLSEPCEDAISREEMIKIADELECVDGTINAEKLRTEICLMPSVTPKEKTGHWIFDEILDKHYYCSECKSMGVDYWDYCPNCGSYNGGGDNGNE